MTVWTVLGSGPSMRQELVDYVHGKCQTVAVSDTYRLAPWADAIVSHDAVWWDVHTEAWKLAGRKFSGRPHPAVELLPFDVAYLGGINSGLQGMRAAALMGASKILLLGFDMHGDHFFGAHPYPLQNTTADRLAIHIRQFDLWKGCPVTNCTPGSALKRFPYMALHEALR